jgi:hypothetical protein
VTKDNAQQCHDNNDSVADASRRKQRPISTLRHWFRGRIGETVVAVVAGGALSWFVINSASDGDVPIVGAALPALEATAMSSPADSQLCTDTDGSGAGSLSCLMQKEENMCAIGSEALSGADIDIARTAWKYFENNYNPETGLVNAVNNYPSTTMWDTGSALAAFIAAKDFNIITQKEFDDAMMALLESLATIELFDGAAPNKVYHTKTRKMVDYANKEQPLGIGVSVLDLARLISWLNTLQCMHPKYHSAVNSVLSRWDYHRLISDNQMYGLARDKSDESVIHQWQEGRLGYEQYAGKIFDRVGFNVDISKDYNNQYRSNTFILGVEIAYDSRDPREYHANNYVVTESYAMDAMELGIDDQNRELINNIFEVQKRRWEQTGIVTAISEDNIDRKPYFLYNTIYNAGLKFNTTNSSGDDYDHLKSTSTKAAIAMALLFPDEPYSRVLMRSIGSVYDPDGGWYSGIYESGAGYNDVTTANTNGVIMGGLLYKKYGSLFNHCDSCAQPLQIESDLLASHQKARDNISRESPVERLSDCDLCIGARSVSLGTE